FTHTRQISLDIPRFELRFVEWRIKQLNESRILPDQPLFHRFHGSNDTLRIADPGHRSPTLRQTVNLTLGIAGRTKWFTVVKIGAEIPATVPGMSFDVFAEPTRVISA